MTQPRPKPHAGKHRFEDTAVRSGTPVLLCVKCPRVWWPDKPRPHDACSESRTVSSKSGSKPTIENPVAELMAPGGDVRPRKSP